MRDCSAVLVEQHPGSSCAAAGEWHHCQMRFGRRELVMAT